MVGGYDNASDVSSVINSVVGASAVPGQPGYAQSTVFGKVTQSEISVEDLQGQASRVVEENANEESSSGSGEMIVGVNDDMSSVQSLIQ